MDANSARALSQDGFSPRLDQLFVEQYGTSRFHFLGQFPDATGLVGLYSQGNEPSFHIPYLYDFSGQPWKAQKRIRQLLDVWYGDGPLGFPVTMMAEGPLRGMS
jgi:putative alpha-1,2-mannosidase